MIVTEIISPQNLLDNFSYMPYASAKAASVAVERSLELTALTYNVCGAEFLIRKREILPTNLSKPMKAFWFLKEEAKRLLLAQLKQDKERYRKIGALISSIKADVVALQEVWCEASREVCRLSDYRNIAYADSNAKLIGGSGLATLSKYKIIRDAFFEFSNRSGLECFVKKGALFTEIEHRQGMIHVWNVHRAAPREGLQNAIIDERRTRVVRKLQLEQLCGWINKFTPKQIPCIIIGDFNAVDESEDQELAALGEDLYVSHYGGSFEAARQRDHATYDSENPYAQGKSRVSHERFDRIYFRSDKELCVKDARIVFNKREEQLSDHHGVYVKFKASNEGKIVNLNAENFKRNNFIDNMHGVYV